MENTAEKFRRVMMDVGAVLVPEIGGAIDCTHVKIKTPSMVHSETYYTITQRAHTISCQAICDRDKVFYDVMVGYPGRMNDGRIFTESGVLSRVPLGYRILGDGAYVCSSKLMSPYRDLGNLDDDHRKWNSIISKGRICIEQAFGIAKNRFRILKRNEIVDLKFLNEAVYACFCLHNYCVRMLLPDPDCNGDPLPPGVEPLFNSGSAFYYNESI